MPTSALRRASRPNRVPPAIVLAAALLAGCSSNLSPPNSPTRNALPTLSAEAVEDPEALRVYYNQTLQWKECDQQTGFQCATMNVPLDYDQPDSGEEVRVAVARKTTKSDDRIGSLLVNPGGPGASAIEYLQQAAANTYPAQVRERYDMVAVDPRGAGQSQPVKCGMEYAHDPTPQTGAEINAMTTAAKKFAAACREQAGALLGHVSTVEAARDMDVLRALLGDDELHYVGKSYGTLLGATYAELFPSRVGRLVLDGAVDPAVDAREKLRVQAHATEVGFQSFVKDCVRRADCPLGASVSDAELRFEELMRKLSAAPLPTKRDGRTLNELHAYAGVSATLGETDSWPELRTALAAAIDGDGTGLLLLSNGAENPDDSNTAVRCLDQPPAMRGPKDVQKALPSFEKASPHFGAVSAWEGLDCAYWPVQATSEPHRIEAKGTDPVLVLGTSRDPSTPHEWAKSLADQLDSGLLLTYDGDGHTAYTRGSSCIDAAVNTYLLTGKPPTDGNRCGP